MECAGSGFAAASEGAQYGQQLLQEREGGTSGGVERVGECGDWSELLHEKGTQGQFHFREPFCLKNCPKLKELKVGRCSFAEYSVCEIENVDALETIEMSSVNNWGNNFQYASLELRSVCVESA